jgi:diguanylate cyclase (GGDEF)-like protein
MDRIKELEEQLGEAYLRISQLEALNLTDELTGLSNRRGLNTQLPKSLSQADRNGSDLTFIAIDIDHFKAVNDTHGHDAGDAVLQRVAKTISTVIRAGDYAFRQGGEEMTVIATTSFKGAEILAEKLRAAVAGSAERDEIDVTISLGVAMAHLKDTPEALMKRADDALYRAKLNGRDRAEVA